MDLYCPASDLCRPFSLCGERSLYCLGEARKGREQGQKQATLVLDNPPDLFEQYFFVKPAVSGEGEGRGWRKAAEGKSEETGAKQSVVCTYIRMYVVLEGGCTARLVGATFLHSSHRSRPACVREIASRRCSNVRRFAKARSYIFHSRPRRSVYHREWKQKRKTR